MQFSDNCTILFQEKKIVKLSGSLVGAAPLKNPKRETGLVHPETAWKRQRPKGVLGCSGGGVEGTPPGAPGTPVARSTETAGLSGQVGGDAAMRAHLPAWPPPPDTLPVLLSTRIRP